MTNTPSIGDLLAGRDWFRLQYDAEHRTALLHVYGSIGSSEWWDDVASPSLVRELDALDVDEITMYVNSPGGIADDGVAIMNALARNKARVVAHVDGLAASAATIVLLGADEIVMNAGSRLMIHDAWSITWGQASVIQKTAERLDKLSQTLAGLYAQRAGGTADEWRAAMVEETWYTAEEAVEAGLADRVAPVHAASDDDARNLIPIADAARAFGWRHPGREAASAPFIPSHSPASARRDVSDRKPPVSTEPGTTNRKDEAMAYGDLQAGLRERLGVTDADASDEMLLAALDETLNEQADPPLATVEPLPEGVAVIDSTVLAELREQAAAGAQARAEQTRQRRDSLLEAALADGRITPAARDHWAALLEDNEDRTSALLAGLHKNAVPMVELGHSDTLLDAEDALYAKYSGEEV